MPVSSRTPDLAICLWFDGTARAAAEFYVSLFADSEITSLNLVRDGADGGVSGREIAFVGFTVAGRPFQALDGGPMFTHSPAVSVVVPSVAFQTRATVAGARLRTAVLVNASAVRGTATVRGIRDCVTAAQPGEVTWLDCSVDRKSVPSIITVTVSLKDGRIFSSSQPVVRL